jgi:hypothetical protein
MSVWLYTVGKDECRTKLVTKALPSKNDRAGKSPPVKMSGKAFVCFLAKTNLNQAG